MNCMGHPKRFSANLTSKNGVSLKMDLLARVVLERTALIRNNECQNGLQSYSNECVDAKDEAKRVRRESVGEVEPLNYDIAFLNETTNQSYLSLLITRKQSVNVYYGRVADQANVCYPRNISPLQMTLN